ncbi:hypothetical protein JT359_17930 [Candidatus Poribacteria bacterium]|nr:hypothetical protein [Candidatus Poribacteria bacterium]
MNNEQHQARVDGEQDAELDVSKILWIVVGFFISLIGILIAYIYQPNPPATKLLDKSQEYIMFYTEAYKDKSRSIQLTYSAIGFAISTGITIFFFLVGVAIIGSSM